LVDRFNSRATHRAFISDPYKVLQSEGQQNQFFNLQTDPLEAHDLSADDPVFNEMESAFQAFLERVIARRPANLRASNVNLTSEQVTKRLRGLGYLD
jgi:hypothetical protein